MARAKPRPTRSERKNEDPLTRRLRHRQVPPSPKRESKVGFDFAASRTTTVSDGRSSTLGGNERGLYANQDVFDPLKAARRRPTRKAQTLEHPGSVVKEGGRPLPDLLREGLLPGRRRVCPSRSQARPGNGWPVTGRSSNCRADRRAKRHRVWQQRDLVSATLPPQPGTQPCSPGSNTRWGWGASLGSSSHVGGTFAVAGHAARPLRGNPRHRHTVTVLWCMERT